MDNNLLLERSKVFAKYAEHIPRKADKIELKLDYPDCGWIDMHFKVNGEEKVMISASDVYEPFEDVRDWLESITKYTPAIVHIYDESDYYYLYYEPLILDPCEPSFKNHNGPLGLFYIYDRSVKQIVADAVCQTRKFVRSLYESILSYAKESSKQENFEEAWIEGAYNHEWGQYEDGDPRIKDIFTNMVTSQVVEDYLTGQKNKNV